jgi:brefeldin A-inhibited guanine nucleotide-exchange protein
MERLQLIGNRDSTAPSPIRANDSGAGGVRRVSFSKEDIVAASKTNPTLEKLIADFSSQKMVVVVDRIFSSTDLLSGAAILQFFKALCQVSLEEVGIDPSSVQYNPMSPSPSSLSPGGSGGNQSGSLAPLPAPLFVKDVPPRMYLLQKIVEIAHYNMHRIRYEWSQIWR